MPPTSDLLVDTLIGCLRGGVLLLFFLCTTSHLTMLNQVTTEGPIDILKPVMKGLAYLKRGPFSCACALRTTGCEVILVLPSRTR
jgi:hypothetical protein